MASQFSLAPSKAKRISHTSPESADLLPAWYVDCQLLPTCPHIDEGTGGHFLRNFSFPETP